MDERDLIYDWNAQGKPFDWAKAKFDLNDETLRDGLQSPSVRDPDLETKRRLLHLMADLGIAAADIGLPGAGPRVVEQVRHEDHAHRGEMLSHVLAPDPAEVLARGHVGGLVAAVRGDATDVLRSAAGLREHGEDVLQRLLELRRDRLGVELLLRLPAYLAGDEYDAASIDCNAVGVADWRRPAFG